MSSLRRQNSSPLPDLAPQPTSLDGAGSTITNIVFGILALVVGTVTIWQAYRVYQIWHPATNAVDLQASRAEELESRAGRNSGDSISLPPRTSQNRQSSNTAGSDFPLGQPQQVTAELA